MFFPESKMRRWLLTIISVCCFVLSGDQLYAQKVHDPVYVYVSGGGGIGSFAYGFIELHTLFLKHHDISLGYSGFQQKATAIPDDYKFDNWMGLGLPPENFLNGFTAVYSYLFYPKSEELKKIVRFPVGAGAVIGKYSEPGNFHKVNILGSSYDYDDVTRDGFAVMLRGGAEFTPTRVFGLNVGGFILLGNMVGGGVYGSISLGYVGSKRGSLID